MKASVFIATSVDGFIARVNGDLDWLHAAGGEDHGYDAFMATVDALVIGRKTFETVLGFDAWPYGDTPVYVVSTRALPATALGAGIPLFGALARDVLLTHVGTRQYASGLVQSEYTIAVCAGCLGDVCCRRVSRRICLAGSAVGEGLRQRRATAAVRLCG